MRQEPEKEPLPTTTTTTMRRRRKKLFVWGCGEDYQLGLERAKKELDFCIEQPTEIPWKSFCSSSSSSSFRDDGDGGGKTRALDEEEENDDDDDARQIERLIAGSRNSCVLTSEKELYSWGWNSHDTLGLSESLTNNNNKNKDNNGNDNDKEFIKTPMKATYFTHDTTDELQQLHIKDEFVESEIVRVALGGWHALAVDQFGRVHAWGGNEYGQCATEKKKIEEGNKENNTAATTWGSTSGADEERKKGVVIDDRGYANTSISTPITIPLDWKSPKTLIKAKRVACGGMSSFAVTVDGDVYSWGCPVGGVGPNTYHPKKVENLRDCCEIAAGSFHVLALTKDGTVYSWGHGEYGQLGHQKTGNEATPRAIETLNRKGVVKIRAGGWHSACITAGGQLLTWGRGEYARLGMGDDDCADKITPTEVNFSSSLSTSSSSPRNDNDGRNHNSNISDQHNNEHNDHNNDNNGNDDDDDDDESKHHKNYKIVDASLGGSHTIALTSRGQLLSWGRNSLGRLGRVVNGPYSGRPGEVKFPPLPNGGKWVCVKLSCGGRHNMALCVETTSKEERERVLRDAFDDDNNTLIRE
jgi:alpha-tubulin suppressor-like RCC1 family protein